MTLIFSGVFISEAFAILMLIGLVASPVLLIVGIAYFLRRDYTAATFVITLAAAFASAMIAGVSGVRDVAFPEAFAVPLGYLALFAASMTGSKGLGTFVGALVNFTAIFAVVRFIEKRVEK